VEHDNSGSGLLAYHATHHKPEEVAEDESTQAPWLHLLEKRAGSLAGASILDVGCGTAGFMLACHKRGARPVGVDLPHIIQVARDGLVRVIGDTLPLVSADGRRLPFRDGSFDIVVSIGVLEHVPRPAALVEEMARVLRRGGIFMLYFGPNGRLRFAQSRAIDEQYQATGHLRKHGRQCGRSNCRLLGWCGLTSFNIDSGTTISRLVLEDYTGGSLGFLLRRVRNRV
jgi:SAM-dependent methyltransferase